MQIGGGKTAVIEAFAASKLYQAQTFNDLRSSHVKLTKDLKLEQFEKLDAKTTNGFTCAY